MSLKNWITVCSYCHKYRRSGGEWQGPVMDQDQLKGILSHGACPCCYHSVLAQIMSEVREELVGA